MNITVACFYVFQCIQSEKTKQIIKYYLECNSSIDHHLMSHERKASISKQGGSSEGMNKRPKINNGQKI